MAYIWETIIENTNEVEVGILYLKDGKYSIYTIDKNGTSTVEPIKMSALSEKEDKAIIITPLARVKNDQPFVLSLVAVGKKDKNNSSVEIITDNSLYLKYDNKFLEQIAKRYKHIFIVAVKLTNKLQ